MVICRDTEPLKFASGVKLKPSSAALISVREPWIVIVAVPSLPEIKVRPLVPDKVKIPSLILSVVSSKPVPVSTSLMEIRLPFAVSNTSAVSSFVVCGDGTELTGASLTGVMVIVTAAALETFPSRSSIV